MYRLQPARRDLSKLRWLPEPPLGIAAFAAALAAAYYAYHVPIRQVSWWPSDGRLLIAVGAAVFVSRSMHALGMPLIRSLRCELASEASTQSIRFDVTQGEALLRLDGRVQAIESSQLHAIDQAAELLRALSASSSAEIAELRAELGRRSGRDEACEKRPCSLWRRYVHGERRSK